MEELNKITDYIINSDSYKKCIELRNKMSKNTEIMNLINEIKSLQKKYIKNKKDDIRKELDEKTDKLFNIPIYYKYNKYLEEVNDMISYVEEELNKYFDEVINKS
jgi:cell fate (sporulation/competence/biofilm development) regulator YmcA (YheA/YmcA/DUF963 family)